VSISTPRRRGHAGAVDPRGDRGGSGYRVGFKNFEVITRYNRSVRYAMAVHDLATTIADRVAVADAARAEKAARLAARKPAEGEAEETAER
jgi:membrane-bound lytic murein transglycosylase B